MRTITIYSTLGGIKKIETEAKTWGELKNQLDGQYDFTRLDATESVNKTTLSHNDAVLPEGACTIFLRPSKAAGGVVDSSTPYSEITSMLTDEYKEKIKAKYGRPYNMVSKTVLIEFINAEVAKAESNDEDDNDIVESSDCEEITTNLVDQISRIIDVTIDDADIDLEEARDIKDELNTRIQSLVKSPEYMEQVFALENEMRDLSRGF